MNIKKKIIIQFMELSDYWSDHVNSIMWFASSDNSSNQMEKSDEHTLTSPHSSEVFVHVYPVISLVIYLHLLVENWYV